VAKGECSFEDAAKDYLAEVAENTRARGNSQKWVDKQRANIALLVEVLGPGTSLRDVDYVQCRRVRSALAAIPANRTKLYPGLGLERAIQQAEADQKPKMSPTTQDQYLATLRSILSLAVKKRQIQVNPAEDMGPLQRDAVRAKDRRKPWSERQLADFFGSAFYRQCATIQPSAPYLADGNGWRYWMPFLALFMGLRANEICQLQTSDICQTLVGTWYADIVASDDDQGEGERRLKTEASRRKVPIHPELVALGFLDFVEVRATEGGGWLFPTLKPDKYGYYSKYPLKRFAEKFIPEATTLESRQSFYSLRHNFRDALRRADISADGLKGLGGWSQGRTVSDDYGDLENPDFLIASLTKVAYPGLDCSFLHITETHLGNRQAR
jgi:integrase